MFIAGSILLIFQYFFHREQFKIRKQDLGHFFLLALFTIYLTNVFEFWGLKYLTSFKTCFIYSLSPFLSALLSYFILKERLSVKKWAGLVVGFLGFIPILLSQTASEEAGGQLWIFSWAELSVLLAAICSVYGWILLKQSVSHQGYSPIMVNGVCMSIGGLMALFQSAVFENWTPIPVTEIYPFAICTLILIIVSNFIAYNLYGFLLKKHSATFMSFAGLTTPLFTALFGWLILDEVVTFPFYVSFIIVGLGLILFYREELEKKAALPLASAAGPPPLIQMPPWP